jgi:hypothetical protein
MIGIFHLPPTISSAAARGHFALQGHRSTEQLAPKFFDALIFFLPAFSQIP